MFIKFTYTTLFGNLIWIFDLAKIAIPKGNLMTFSEYSIDLKRLLTLLQSTNTDEQHIECLYT